jgi:DNA-binding NarL/FixJ family response regulator
MAAGRASRGSATPELLCPALVGRHDELDVLQAAAQAAAAGRGSLVLVMGEPGVGKSRLLHELRSWCAEHGFAVLTGRAVETAMAMPFRALAEALLAADRLLPIGDDPEVAPFRRALSALVPSLDADGAVPAPPSLLHVAEGFLRVARRSSRGGAGVIVLFDDLHWADAETLAVLDYLTDQVAREPMLIVGTTRPDPGSAALAALQVLLDRRAATLLPLPRLDREQTLEMMRGCLADPAVPAELARMIEHEADGLPFFVEELLAGLAADRVLIRPADRWVLSGRVRSRVPRTFADSVARRLASLSPAEAELVLDAAMLGRQIDHPLLSAVSGVEAGIVDQMSDAAVGLGLLEVAERGHRFRHALTRQALLSARPVTERAARCQRVLTGLRAARPDLDGELAEVAAELAEVAGEPEEATRLLLMVAQRAIAKGALVSTESAQRRALALCAGSPRELEVREALVVTLALAGRPDEAFSEGEVVLARLAEPGLDPDGARRRAVHLAMARAAIAASDWGLAEAHLNQLGPDQGGLAAAVGLAALRAVVALGRYRLDDAERFAAEAVAAADRAEDADLRCEALLVHGRCTRVRDLDAAAAVFQLARAVARQAGLAHWESRATTELGFVRSYYAGDAELLHEARVLAEAGGAPETEAVIEIALTAAAWYRGDYEAQAAHGATAARLAHRHRLGQLEPAAMIMVAAVHAQRGDRAAMETVLAEAEPLICEEPNEVIALRTHCRAACALALEELTQASAEFAAAGELARAVHLTSPPPLLGMAALMAAVDGHDPAEMIADFQARHHDTIPQLAAMLDAARAVGLGRGGDPDAAGEHMQRALAGLMSNQPVSAFVARLVAPAAATDGWGQPTTWLSSALGTFESLGLPAPARACRVALRNLGRRVRRGGDELTARESEVLHLLADGLTNRQLAARLYLSARTVEKHVERLLAKTGAENRAQLATFALRQRDGNGEAPSEAGT